MLLWHKGYPYWQSTYDAYIASLPLGYRQALGGEKLDDMINRILYFRSPWGGSNPTWERLYGFPYPVDSVQAAEFFHRYHVPGTPVEKPPFNWTLGVPGPDTDPDHLTSSDVAWRRNYITQHPPPSYQNISGSSDPWDQFYEAGPQRMFASGTKELYDYFTESIAPYETKTTTVQQEVVSNGQTRAEYQAKTPLERRVARRIVASQIGLDTPGMSRIALQLDPTMVGSGVFDQRRNDGLKALNTRSFNTWSDRIRNLESR